jgi:hypothetical protein
MPYKGELAGKGGHRDIVRNPDVSAFLDKCEYVREPSDAEGKQVAGTYGPAPGGDHPLPLKVAASDASTYNEPISGKFPSTQVGYVKVSIVLIDLKDFEALSAPGSRFVDPFKVFFPAWKQYPLRRREDGPRRFSSRRVRSTQ